MPYKAVLFDLDGTLLDTLEDLADSTNAVLARHGLPVHAMSAYKYFVGDGVESLCRRTLPADRLDAAFVAQCVAAVREEYGRRWHAKTHFYAGVPELLDALVARGVKMAVLSNKPDDLTKLTVQHFLPRWRFDAVCGARPGRGRKPDPAAAVEIAAQLAVPPAEFLYLGDTDTDMQTALAAGMYPLGALWGFRPAEELIASGAKALLAGPLDLLKYLGPQA
ncbi:MAG: HAD family hydrolase [Planctomycetota bacterium]|nr:HAD family hydrolase [Planctomycetota bacterium]